MSFVVMPSRPAIWSSLILIAKQERANTSVLFDQENVMNQLSRQLSSLFPSSKKGKTCVGASSPRPFLSQKHNEEAVQYSNDDNLRLLADELIQDNALPRRVKGPRNDLDQRLGRVQPLRYRSSSRRHVSQKWRVSPLQQRSLRL